jgi:H+/Cl- antiporter ClcA
MSFTENYRRRASRRRIAGCGCIATALAIFVIAGFCILALTMGDCGSSVPNCHAKSERLLDKIIWSLGAIGIATAVGLAWWANKSPKDD